MILESTDAIGPIQFSEQPVQTHEHLVSRPDRDWRWHDMQLLATLADCASFRRAAKRLKVSVNTVRARLDRLEADLGVTLFLRGHTGISLSVDGIAWLEVAAEMKSASLRSPDESGNRLSLKAGEIAIGCSEGIGEFWLTPRIPLLQEALPKFTISLRNEVDQQQIHSRNNDVSLGFIRPSDPESVVARIASLHFMMYASDRYLRLNGAPRSFDEASAHRFVIQEAPGLHGDAISLFLGEEVASRLLAVKVNTSYSLYRAVADGTGIGALPTYVRAITRQVRPLDIPFQLKFDLWMSYSQELRHSEPLKRTVSWIRDCFDPAKYPWFASRFHHPDSFDQLLGASNIVPLHEHF